MPEDQFTAEVHATNEPGEVGPVDVVLFTVKTYHNATAIPAMRPMVSESTTVLSLQNGVETFDELTQSLGFDCVLSGVANFGAYIEAAGVIANRGNPPAVIFGEVDGKESPRAKRILETFQKAGVNAGLSNDVTKTLWTKFLLLPSTAGMTCVTRLLTRSLLEHPEAREMWIAGLREVEAVGRAKGVNLDPDVVAQAIGRAETLPWDYQLSMHVDLDQGRQLELEAVNGAVVKMGRQVGIPTPVNQFLYTVLKPHIDGAATPKY
jgi:2-dehydropantoate 2-reductase